MKKIAPYIILVLLAMVAWDALFDSGGFYFDVDDGDFNGPFASLIGMIAAGGGLVIGVIALIFAAVVVAVVFAGLGVLAICGLALGALIVVACVAPFMLPILIPVAIIWALTRRDRKQRRQQAV